MQSFIEVYKVRMISHKHKFIFIHIPKTGGSSVDCFFTNTYREGGLRTKHRTAQTYKLQFPNQFSEYFKFTIVRNPWDKCFSHYNYKARDSSQPGFSGHLLFSDWLKKNFSNPLVFNNHFDFLSNTRGKVSIDYIMRFETLEYDFDIVCNRIGVPSIGNLPHINKTNHEHYTEYYDDETREIVARKYAKDIEYFGYKFGR